MTEKERILAGIDAGLKDLKAGRMQNAWDVLKELKDEEKARKEKNTKQTK